MQKTSDIPDLSDVQLPEGFKTVGQFENGAKHLLLVNNHGMWACLRKYAGIQAKYVKVPNSREFVHNRRCRTSGFKLHLSSDPTQATPVLDLVCGSEKDLLASKLNFICSGTSRVNVVQA